MAAVVIAIASMALLGLPLVLAADRDAPPLRLFGLSFLYGSGAIYLILFALSALRVRWTMASAAIAALAVFLAAIRRPHIHAWKPRINVIDLATLVAVAGYAVYATIAALWEFDFWALWGLKAKTFAELGGIDWQWLQQRDDFFLHADYPLLVPLNFDFVAIIGGGWSDRWLGALFVAWTVALLFVVRDLARRETTPAAATLITFAVSMIVMSRHIGTADVPLIAYSAAGVLFVRRALLFDEAAAWRHGAILLGLAGCTKNEGIAWIASVAIAVALSDARRIVRLWPALALVAPWLIAKLALGLSNDIVTASALSRAAARLRESGTILTHLDRYFDWRWFWAALLAGLLAAPAKARSRERFVLAAVAAQLAIYIGTYYATPHDLHWQISMSWPRLTEHLAVPMAYTVMTMLVSETARREAGR